VYGFESFSTVNERADLDKVYHKLSTKSLFGMKFIIVIESVRIKQVSGIIVLHMIRKREYSPKNV